MLILGSPRHMLSMLMNGPNWLMFNVGVDREVPEILMDHSQANTYVPVIAQKIYVTVNMIGKVSFNLSRYFCNIKEHGP